MKNSFIPPSGVRGLFLFAALVSVSFATTSCQKEENIVPSGTYAASTPTHIVGTKTKDEAPDEYTEIVDVKPQSSHPAKTASSLPRTKDNIRPEVSEEMK